MSCYLMTAAAVGAIAAAGYRGMTAAAVWHDGQARFYNAATKEMVQYKSVEEAANALALQNIASCEARYPGKIAGGFLKNAEEQQAYLAGAAKAAKNLDMTDIQGELVGLWKPMKLWGLVNTFKYQACETDDWHETNAYWFCDMVANRAAGVEQRAQEEAEAA